MVGPRREDQASIPPDDDAEFGGTLTLAQRDAVFHREGPLLVIAGPGSGKTRVVTYRVAQLLRSGVAPHQILALTFTNKAAEEMQRRVQQLAPAAGVWMGTFHRFCAHLLRRHAPLVGLQENFTIFDTDDSLKICKAALAAFPQVSYGWTPQRLLQEISRLKTSLITAAQFERRPGRPEDAALAVLYPAYQQALFQCNAADFDDLLLHVAVMIRENGELRQRLDAQFRYIMVDEYQDTNLVQYAIVRGLSVDYPNLAATGDPDQSIYGWRGANVNNILEFEKDYPRTKVVKLEQNYRSTPSILHVADVLISHNQLRKPKALFTENPDGPQVRLCILNDHQAEADAIASRIDQSLQEGYSASDFAIFYRVSHLSRTLELSLRRRGIPYQVVRGIEFYQRQEVRNAIAYLQLVNNPRNDAAFLRIVNVPRRGLGATTEKRLQAFTQQHGGSLLEALGHPACLSQLGKGAAKSAKAFFTWMQALQSQPPVGVASLLRRILEESNYLSELRSAGTPEDTERAENLEEFLNDASEYDAMHETGDLDQFLERVALVSDVDQWEPGSERVTLMTLHAAKGLEFPCVFIVGVEQNLLPHARSIDSITEMEEERRLLFVGITRAERELQLSCAKRRMVHGSLKPAIVSSFLMELPRDSLEVLDESEPRRRWDPQAADPDGDVNDPGQDDDHAWIDRPGSEEDSFVPVVRGATMSEPAPREAKIVTAASMVTPPRENAPQVFAAHDFQVGCTVIHPEYGPGKLTRMTGSLPRRSVTVQFALSGKSHTFILEKSPLRPAPRP